MIYCVSLTKPDLLNKWKFTYWIFSKMDWHTQIMCLWVELLLHVYASSGILQVPWFPTWALTQNLNRVNRKQQLKLISKQTAWYMLSRPRHFLFAQGDIDAWYTNSLHLVNLFVHFLISDVIVNQNRSIINTMKRGILPPIIVQIIVSWQINWFLSCASVKWPSQAIVWLYPTCKM